MLICAALFLFGQRHRRLARAVGGDALGQRWLGHVQVDVVVLPLRIKVNVVSWSGSGLPAALVER
jgi:hypothetical protein